VKTAVISRKVKTGARKLLAKGIQFARKTKLLRKAEKSRMESMFKSMAEGVIMTDDEGEIEVLNPQAKRMLGLGVAITARKLNSRLQEVGLAEILEKARSKKRLVSKEIVISQGRDNATLYCSASAVKDEVGQSIGVVTVLRDVTKEKEIDRMKTDFVTTVSHELRTPLSITKEGVGLVLDGIPGSINDQQKKILGAASESIDRLSRIINSLLDISRIEEGRLECKREAVDIVSLARRACLSFEPKAKNKGLELKMSLCGDKIDVYADADRIAQVFTNLIGNSVKFTQKGWIEVSVKELEDEVECAVIDTGIGISDKDLPNMFKKFHQFSRTAGAGEKGTGLGLSITKAIVEMHNGRIWVMSKLGSGAKFIFTLPKYSEKEVFRCYVEEGVKESLRKGLKISLVIISIVNLKKLKKILPEERLGEILKSMEGVLNNSLRREGDVAFNYSGDMVVLLGDCDKRGVLGIESRLRRALKEFLIQNKLLRKVKLGFGSATCPDDAVNSQELFKKAKKTKLN